MRELIYPGYKCSAINVMSSIMSYYGVQSNYDSLPILDAVLDKPINHVVHLVFDGLGYESIMSHLSRESCLRKHCLGPIESVFPPTTTAAMTSYYTGEAPGHHGWLGWSLYMKEYGTMVDLFPNTDSFTGETMATKRIAYRELPYRSLYEKLDEVNGNRLEIHTAKPENIYFSSTPNRHHPLRDLNHLTKVLKKIDQSGKRAFTAAYWPEPDLTMHEFGPSSEQAAIQVKMVNDYVSTLVEELDDTLLIISADHGLVPVQTPIDLREDKKINDMLVMPPSMEPRCMSFHVKSDQLLAFRKHFEDMYGEDFLLFDYQEVIDRRLFGHGPYHERFSDFVGDYLAIAIRDKILTYKTVTSGDRHIHKGHHAGLTYGEMMIPLIVIKTYESET